MSDKDSAIIPSTTPFAPSSLEGRRIIDFAKASAEAVGIEGVGLVTLSIGAATRGPSLSAVGPAACRISAS